MALAPNLIFGNYLKTIRITRNIDLEEVARKTGTSVAYLTEVECGRKAITGELLVRYPTSLGIPIRILMQEYLNAQLATLCYELNMNVERCELRIATQH